MCQTSQGSKSLYIYPELMTAYKKGTRSADGSPGKKYWQNRSDYKIVANLDPSTGKITGTERITYFNNSPDSLSYLVIRTYPDFYKCTNVKDYTVNEGDCSDGMHIDTIGVENDSAIDYRRGGTNLYLTLSRKLSPDDHLTLLISWNFLLPKTTQIREGIFFKTSFFVAYWYPQISVYDDYNGWDSFNYTGLQEFYNDFNSYDVTIKIPENFIVWATGEWKNPSEILTKSYLDKYSAGQTSDSVIHIIDTSSRKNSLITKRANNAYHFTADSVCDFSFAASDSFLWDMTSVDDGTKKRKVTISLLYHPTIPNFGKLALPAKEVIKHLSTKWPAIPYPFPHLSIFSGEGGMEYAMMINQAYIQDEQAVSVMAHEIAHAYFPFLVASNERRYAWMDEVFAQTLPNDCEIEINHKIFKPQQINKYFIAYTNSFLGTSLESPPMELSINQKGGSYYFSAYTRPTLALTYLREMVGDSLFKQAIRVYINRWKFKHPSPYDFFYTINTVTKRNLDWFWKLWFFDHAYPDLAIKEVRAADRKLELELQQLGNLPVPLRITCFFEDGTTMSITRNASIWEKTNTVKIVAEMPAQKKLQRIEVNIDSVPDIDLSNNSYSKK